MLLHSLRKGIGSLRNLSRIMSRRDAARLLLAAPGRECSIFLKPAGRAVTLRAGSADMAVLEKVFLQQDYAWPFSDRPARIVDAGAHIGLSALFFARSFPASRIVAIEPAPSNLQLLQRNCAGENSIQILPAALWNRSAELACENAAAATWSYRMFERPPSDTEPAIRGMTMEEVFQLTGWAEVDLLKIDIEGAEAELFGESATPWLGRVKAIAIELHDRVRPGCSRQFYDRTHDHLVAQEIRGENVFVRLKP